MPVLTENLTTRIPKELKHQAAIVSKSLGMPLTTAVTVFLTRFVEYRGFPFQVVDNSTPNAETLEAVREGEDAYKRGKAKKQSPADFLTEMGGKA
jgi:addiction module RelB/DinJ family antitoxin